jgi:diadenosine tetraphosphate (Ap4A) HIT family hydrolase
MEINMKDYDEKNVFNKILREEMTCNKVYEDNNNLSFEDISKQAPVHVLTIPKKKYKDFSAFAENASDVELSSFLKSIFKVANKKEINKTGYRIIINCGLDSNQEVQHLHAHILGGKNLGPILK